MNMDDYIKLEKVTFSYGGRVILKDLQLELSRQTSYALIGKSGAGKSTLLKLLAGFLKPDNGRITINGSEVKGPGRETAFLFQELGLFPWQTVEEAVAMPLKLRGRKAGCREAVYELLKELRLENYGKKYPQELSGGEQQRVALARTLIGEPELLLMDEPTSSLDTMTKEELQQLLLKELKKRKTTLLFVTHDIEEAMLLGQKIVLLNGDKTLSVYDNSFYAAPNAREQLGFYDECIKIRKLLRLEN